MSDITVVGLGSMGSALARTLLSAGHQVTVWNRSQAKAEQLASDGAIIEATVSNAVEASAIVLICVSNYSTTREIFESGKTASAISNRIVVQLSSGTPREACTDEYWFVDKGASYLDGAILGSPKVIGTKDGQILISGNEDSWKKCQPVLQCMAGNFQYAGSKVDSAKILDLAWLSQRLGLFMGVFQGLLLCEAGGIGPDVFGLTVAADQRVRLMADTIHNETYNEPINTVKVWNDALHHIQVQARDTGTNSEVLNFIADKFKRAQVAGYEEEDLAAILKILR